MRWFAGRGCTATGVDQSALALQSAAQWGEVVQAAVQLKSHILPTEDLQAQLMAFLRERVARFKLPRVMTFVQQLPRTPTGKLLVRELKTVSW